MRRIRATILLLLPCLVASLLCSSCIAPIPMTKRVSGPSGAMQQKKIDLSFVQPGKTSRNEVGQKLAWPDSGIKDDHLFLARWASSRSGWVWFVGGHLRTQFWPTSPIQPCVRRVTRSTYSSSTHSGTFFPLSSSVSSATGTTWIARSALSP